MHDPDPAMRDASTRQGGPPASGGGGALSGPHTLQILSSEHWSLLASRSLCYTEAMSRASIFVAALTGSVVALALVAQATDFGDGFVAFALVLLPVVFFLGLVTILRLGQINREDAVWVQGINRIRHAYLELAPELEPYFVASAYDDRAGILRSSLAVRKIAPPLQGFIALPGVIAVLDAVVAGTIVAIAAVGLGAGIAGALPPAVATFVLALAGFVVLALRSIARSDRDFVVRFPSPPPD
jgi:hypothetical protein